MKKIMYLKEIPNQISINKLSKTPKHIKMTYKT